jgi:hypothetical protein
MKKHLFYIGAVFLMALCTLPALAALDGTGYYRVRNAAEGQTNQYMSFANDIINFTNIIHAPGGAENLGTNPQVYVPLAMSCVDAYLKNDIHLIEPDFIDPATVIYVKLQNSSSKTYNLIAQGTSLLTLTTGIRYGSRGNVYFENLYAIIKDSGSANGATLYTAYLPLKVRASIYGIINTNYTLGNSYFEDKNGTFSVLLEDSIATFTNNFKWYIEPLTYFNVRPEVALNGKYFTTLKVPFQCKLDGNDGSSVEKAYVITGVNADGELQYQELTSRTIPAGTPVLLECSSSSPADCKLYFISKQTTPLFTAPNSNASAGESTNWNPSVSSVEGANESSDYDNENPGVNKLKGTYFCNTDGTMYYNTTSGVNKGYFYGNHYTDTAGLYELGIDSNGKVGFVKAQGITTPQNIQAMPANKAWMEQGGIFRSAEAPTITPASSTSTSPIEVTITSSESDATIHYTTDGSDPTWESDEYTGSFTLNESATVKAIAIKPGLYNASDVVSESYTIEQSTPTLTVNPTSLTINDSGTNNSFTVEGENLIDNIGVTPVGFEPTLSATVGQPRDSWDNGTHYFWFERDGENIVNGTVAVNYTGTELYAEGTMTLGTKLRYDPLEEISKTVNVTYRPDIYIIGDYGNGWGYNDATNKMTFDGTIYTTTVEIPANSYFVFARKLNETGLWDDGRSYFGPSYNNWPVSGTETNENLDLNNHNVFKVNDAGEYTITINPTAKTFSITRTIETVATPTFTPAAGTYNSIQSVTISCTTPEAVIHYTTNGSEPTADSPVYNGAITVAENMTIKAIALKDGWNPSQVATAEYIINLPKLNAPTFSPAAGTYTSAQSVEITAEQGATIYYKIDNGTYQIYSSPISVTGNCTITAYATKQGYTNSDEASAAYIIKYPVATPTFNPPAGTYNGAQSVTISCETSGASIYYKIDNGDYQLYNNSPISVNESCTITAYATKDGWTDSGVNSAQYVINHPTLAIEPSSLDIKENGGTFTVSGTYIDGNINVSLGNTSDWNLNPETLSSTGGDVTVAYSGRALSAQNTVNAQPANNSSLTASGTVNYRSDVYIVTDNGVQGQWNFNNGSQMGYENGIYTATFTANEPNTFILFARKLGDGVNWNTRYVFGPASNGDWSMPNDKVTENGNIDLNDDDPIKLPYAGEYTITIDATDPANPTFTISRVLDESTLANIESNGVVGNAYTVTDELIGVWAVNNDNDKLLWAKDQGNVSIDKRPAKTDDQTDYMVTHMKYQHYPWEGYDWDESNWVILDFGTLNDDPESYVGHKLENRSVSGIYSDANNYTIKLSDAPIYANRTESSLDAPDYPGYAGVHDESNYGTKYAWAYNTYMPANFNEANLNRLENGVVVGAQSGPNALANMQNQLLYFMNPKIMEVAHLWGVWDGNGRFVILETSFDGSQTINAWDLHGAVDVLSWDYNRKGQYEYGEPNELEEGKAQDFHALILRKPASNKLTSDASSATYGIIPLDMPQKGHPTTVKELTGNRVVKSTSYYNVMGMESSKPFKGVNIVVTRYSDGSSTTTKVLY